MPQHHSNLSEPPAAWSWILHIIMESDTCQEIGVEEEFIKHEQATRPVAAVLKERRETKHGEELGHRPVVTHRDGVGFSFFKLRWESKKLRNSGRRGSLNSYIRNTVLDKTLSLSSNPYSHCPEWCPDQNQVFLGKYLYLPMKGE